MYVTLYFNGDCLFLFIHKHKSIKHSEMVAHSYNLINQEAEIGRQQVPGQPELHRESHAKSGLYKTI